MKVMKWMWNRKGILWWCWYQIERKSICRRKKKKKTKLGTRLKWVLVCCCFFFSATNYLSQCLHIWVIKKTRWKTFCRFFKWTSDVCFVPIFVVWYFFFYFFLDVIKITRVKILQFLCLCIYFQLAKKHDDFYKVSSIIYNLILENSICGKTEIPS